MKRRVPAFLAMMVFASIPLSGERVGARGRTKSAPPPAAIRTMDLGDSNADLVYTPLPLCRIIDTRQTGIILGNTPREFYVAGSTSDFGSQGGALFGCGVPTAATAVLINFVAVTPAGAGNLRGSAWPTPVPATGSIMNYQRLTPNLNIANGIPFPICDHSTTTCTFDIYLQTNGASTHVVADVAGYFKRFANEELITNLIAGDGLTGGGNSGDVSFAVDFAASGTATTVARGDHRHYAQTVIVGPVGTEFENGAALLAANAGISDASASKPYLLKIEPGIYDLSNDTLFMRPFVDIEGSGEIVTILKKRTSPNTPPIRGVIEGASDAEVRLLTAEVNGGADPVAVALSVAGTAPRLSNVKLVAATGVENIAVRLSGGSVTMDASTVIAAGGTSSYGVLGLGGAVINLRRVRVSASVGSALNIGVMNDAAAVAVVASTELVNTTVTAFGGTRSEGITSTRANAFLKGVTVSATLGFDTNIAVRNITSTDACVVRIDTSTLIGATATIENTSNYITTVGASKLEGGNVIPGAGTVTCTGSYDENYTNTGGFGVCP